MDCAKVLGHWLAKGRAIGRFSRWLSLGLVAGLVICGVVFGPRWSCGSQPDELATSAGSRGAAGTPSRTPAKKGAKRPEPLATPAQNLLAFRDNGLKSEATNPTENAVATRSPDISGDRSPIARALDLVAECQVRYKTVADYTCTFYKRERVAGRLTGLHVMTMKVRRDPQSIYVKFQQPVAGREAIYIAGRNGGRLLAHDVGFNKLLAGTLLLDPTSSRAMEENRHPITEAGIGPLLDTLAARWSQELNPDETLVLLRDDALVGHRHCNLIEVTHPHPRHHFLHHKVRVYIDKELGLPIRFEAYDWPKKADAPPQLTEEYTYMNLRLNVRLGDIDFDTANPDYSFGRF